MKTTKRIMRVAILGDGAANSSDIHYLQAMETGRLLARAGYIVVNGGGPGVMQAATLGAKEAEGRVEVVILDPDKQPINYEGVSEENVTAADVVITTDCYSDRLNKLIEIADAFLIFKGGTGTLSEVGLTWQMAKFEYGEHEPLVFVGECWKNIVPTIVKDLNFEKIEEDVVRVVLTPEDAVEALKEMSSYSKEEVGLGKSTG